MTRGWAKSLLFKYININAREKYVDEAVSGGRV